MLRIELALRGTESTKHISATKTGELYFIPGQFSTDQAQQTSLVSEVSYDDSFAAEINTTADQLAQSIPLAPNNMKNSFVSVESMSLRDYIKIKTERHNKTDANEDSHGAFKAFIETREPQFTRR